MTTAHPMKRMAEVAAAGRLQSLAEVAAEGQLLTIAEVATRKGVSIAGALRWILDGLRTSDGSRIYLASVRSGWRRFVSVQQLAAFDAALAADDARRIALRASARTKPGAPPPTRRESDALASQRAARELLAARG